MYHAVTKDNIEVAQMLLDEACDPNKISISGQTPLNLARSPRIVKLLMDNGANPNIKDHQGNSALHNFLAKDDKYAKGVLDYYVTTNGQPLDSKDLIVEFNLDLFRNKEGGNEELTMSNHSYMVKMGSQLIYHPLSVAMAELKWNCKSKVIRYLYPTIQFMFTGFLTFMTFCEFDKSSTHIQSNYTGTLELHTSCTFDLQQPFKTPDCKLDLKEDNSTVNGTVLDQLCVNTTVNRTTRDQSAVGPQCFTWALIASACFLLMIPFQIWQILKSPIAFFHKLENWLDILLVLSTVASLGIIFNYEFAKEMCAHLNMGILQEMLESRFFSGISIFFAWFKIVLLFQNSARFGQYIRIFINVSKELLLFLFVYSPVLAAFASGFFVLMPPKTKGFKDVSTSILKTMVMLVGEFNYDGLFINNEDFDGDDESRIGIIVLQLMSVGFICGVSIVISNLLTGLAIKEIGKLKSEAWQISVKEKTDQLVEDENAKCGLRIFKSWDSLEICCKNAGKFLEVYVKPNDNKMVKATVIKKIENVLNMFSGSDYPVYSDEEAREQTGFKFSQELISETLKHLRDMNELPEAKEELKNLITEVIEEGIAERMDNVEEILEKLSKHFKIQ